jgi:hypothetical protein
VAIEDGSDWSGGVCPARRTSACGRSQHQLESTARQMRVLIVTTRIGAAGSVFFGIQQFLIAHEALWLGYVNLASAVVFLLVPQLCKFGDVHPRVMFFAVAYTAIPVPSTDGAAGSACSCIRRRGPPSPASPRVRLRGTWGDRGQGARASSTPGASPGAERASLLATDCPSAAQRLSVQGNSVALT